MNLTFDKKKCILLATWLLIGILSFTVVGKYAAAPESHHATITSLDEKKNTVLELTMAATATSAVITLLPGDIGTPIAEKVADLSGYLLIVLCAIFLEKYLVTITGYAAFKIFIPAACVLFATNLFVSNRSLDRLARKLLVFGICIFLVVPSSVKISDLIEHTYQAQIEATLEEAKGTEKRLENNLKPPIAHPAQPLWITRRISLNRPQSSLSRSRGSPNRPRKFLASGRKQRMHYLVRRILWPAL